MRLRFAVVEKQRVAAAAQAILRQLITEYGVALHLPTGDNQIAAHIAQETGLAQGTVLGILSGSTERINENTRNKLASLFNRAAIPRIQPVWLSSRSLAEFNSKRAGSGLIPIRMPTDYLQQVERVGDWLCGIHIVYRYSLDFIDTGDVAREVIHIWNDGAILQFKMSFINQSGREKNPVYFFEGPVLLVGRTAVLLGTNVGVQTEDREYDRARVIVLDHDNAGGDTHDCKIGLMTSTRPRRDHAPCTASTILIRTQFAASPSVFDDLVRTATVIQSLDDIIKSDFGDEFAPQIKTFLDNRPHGYKLEPELEPYVKRGPRPDRVLRLDTDRFATHMGHILDMVIANDVICAPFKENWLRHIREAPK
jgi:hypothetical protein